MRTIPGLQVQSQGSNAMLTSSRSSGTGSGGCVTVYVDGARYLGDPRAIVLAAHQQITIEVGNRVAPPVFDFPPDY